MLPVVKGIPETTRQIGLYTILMVAISLVLFAVGRMGLIYLVAAVVLGAIFLWQAYGLWRRGSSEEASTAGAIRLYKYSISYLSLLFLAVAHRRAGAHPGLTRRVTRSPQVGEQRLGGQRPAEERLEQVRRRPRRPGANSALRHERDTSPDRPSHHGPRTSRIRARTAAAMIADSA